MNVLDFAMKMELQGKAFYVTQAETATVPGLKTILLGLAADEQKHFDVLKGLNEGRERPMANSRMLEQARTVFTEMLRRKDLLEELHEDVDAYKIGMKLEADSVRLYEDLASQAETPETAQLFLKLAGEEKKHFNILENICDFITRPKYYLQWEEYTNLHEY
jgi:rubrerythrin